MLANLKKCEFSKKYLAYLGYVIGEVERKIDLAKMEAIMKWSMPNNVSEARSFIRETWYLRKLITSLLEVATLILTITTFYKNFQWGKDQYRALKELNKKIIQALVLALPNLQ